MQPKYSIAASKANDSFADEIDIYSVSAGWITPESVGPIHRQNGTDNSGIISYRTSACRR